MIKFLLLFLILSTQAWAGFFNSGVNNGPILSCGTGDIFTENGAITMGIWMYYISGGVNSNGRFIARGTSAGPQWYTPSSSSRNIELDIPGGTQLTRVSSTNQLNLNAWQYVLMTWDGSTTASNVHFYVNNTEVSYLQTTNGATPTDNAGATLYIGNRNDGARAMNAYFGEVEIWTKVLSSTERGLAYNSGKQGFNMRNITTALPNLVRWWRLNDFAEAQTGNSTYIDEMGNANCTGSNSPIGLAPFYTFSKNSTLKNSTLK